MEEGGGEAAGWLNRQCSPNIREVESRSSEIVLYYIKSSGLVLQWRRITSKNETENLHLPHSSARWRYKGRKWLNWERSVAFTENVIEKYIFLP